MDTSQAKADCEAKEEKFNKRVRRYEPTNYDASVVSANMNKWSGKVEVALDKLIEAVQSMDVGHSQAFGGTELDTWRGKVNHSEAFLQIL